LRLHLAGVRSMRKAGDTLKNQRVSGFAVIEQVFESAFARKQIAANCLCIILVPFVEDLLVHGYARATIRLHVEVIEHFGQWLEQRGVPLRQLSTLHVDRFLRYHLPRCHCPEPAMKHRRHCQAALRRFVDFLREQKRIREFTPKTPPQGPVDQLILAYDRHMSRVCGFADKTRHRRQVCARHFLRWRFGQKRLRLHQIRPKDLSRFVVLRARQLGPSGLRNLVVGLRSFVRFLELSGILCQGLARAVPQPVRALPPPPPTILDPKERQRFLHSFPRSTPKGRRDHVIALCLSELALRSQEVVELTLDDLDWRAMTLRLRQTKQRRQRLLPLPDSVARAIMNYLKRGRPPTQSRALFVGHLAPFAGPLTASYVQAVVRDAFARCGMEPRGSHLLRHSWATWAHRRGSGLKLIADVLGHRSLESTQRYAHVNLEELRPVALPWPKLKP
jgi:integrase/recombinase XerD